VRSTNFHLDEEPRARRAQGLDHSFVLAGADEAAARLLRRFWSISEAASLGSVETLATRPRDLSRALEQDG
jgi:cystathionine beta-lyase/cystathionine gamma-synthase